MMNRIAQPTDTRSALRVYIFTMFILLGVLGKPDSALAQSQWTTSGNNISNANTGNVGIGTASPASIFSVNLNNTDYTNLGGAGSHLLLTNPSATGQNVVTSIINGVTVAKWRTDFVGNVSWVAGPNGKHVFYTGGDFPNGLERMSILNNGNVGIGTVNPLAKLEIHGPAPGDGEAKYNIQAVDDTALTAGVGGGIVFAGKFLGSAIANFAGIQGMKENGISGNSAGGLIFTTRANGVLPAERLRINSAGNVGIGTSAPAHRLDVNGAVNASAGLCIVGDCRTSWSQVSQWTTSGSYLSYNTGSVGIGTSTPAFKFDVQGGQLNASGGLCIASDCRTSWSQVSQWTTGGSSLYYNTGSVGIGTSAPIDSLHVESSANDRGLFLRNSLTSANATNRIAFANGAISATAIIESVKPAANSIATDLKFWVHNGSTWNFPLYLKNNGNVGIGTTAPEAKLHVEGDLKVSGNIVAKYQDVAEWVPSRQKLSPGTVVVLDPEQSNHVMASASAYDTRVAGVITAQPGLILGEGGEGKVMVATTGRVKVKVDATRAPIKVGDLLVTSEREGMAIKSVPLNLGGTPIHRPGTLIGKALEPMEKGAGEILVLLSLQ